MDYDVVIIGGGPGGYVCAIRAAQLGLKTAIVENREWGGTCLNRGCIPVKAMLHSAEIYHQVETAGQFGISAQKPSVDMEKFMAYRDSVSQKLRDGVLQLLKANGVAVFAGTACISAVGRVELEGEKDRQEILCKNIVIATGSVPSIPPIPGAAGNGVFTSDDLLNLRDHIPETMVIIGGGVIGMEFAQIYSTFGTKITVMEAESRILPMMDKDISRSLSAEWKKRGLEIVAGAVVKEIKKTEKGCVVRFVQKEKEKEQQAECVLIAVGRKANTEGLFAGEMSVEMERGRIVTDEQFQTSVKSIYAIGDVTSKIQLAHVASAQGKMVAEILAGAKNEMDLSVVPSCVYTSPEIACVGMTEAEARKEERRVRCGRYLTASNGKTLISGGGRGFVKLVFDEENGEILGAQLMCERATDMIGELATAVANHMNSEDLLRAMRAHPTVNEAVGEAVEDSLGRAIHVMPSRRR